MPLRWDGKAKMMCQRIELIIRQIWHQIFSQSYRIEKWEGR